MVREIESLRRRGVQVVPCSVLRVKTSADDDLKRYSGETLWLWPVHVVLVLRTLRLVLRRRSELSEFYARIVKGPEPYRRRLRALAHTWLGAYLAALLRPFAVEHIHIHHGYAASWIGMVAARLLNIPFSLTLHGSDLLLHPNYLDLKLKRCKFCVTISEFNRQQIVQRHSDVEVGKIVVQRLGVQCDRLPARNRGRKGAEAKFRLLAVGRLHAVKNHEFLLSACHLLKEQNFPFQCVIVGDGPEREALLHSIARLGLQNEVGLVGYIAPSSLDPYYSAADLVVLTSRSEGIPLVLMEAMARGTPVLAPAITGIPELVIDGTTGFLYQPGSIRDFVEKVELVRGARSGLSLLLERARNHVLEHFSQEKNLMDFCDLFLSHLADTKDSNHENPILQQI